jgi:SAM-dependent methyltransferase
MDLATLGAYDRFSSIYASEWEDQPAPTDLQTIVNAFFRPGATADIGCGSGRDTAWLDANGFPAVGYDASAGLLEQARARHPGLSFRQSALPGLIGVEEESFINVLCETVIMHLPAQAIAPSVSRLADVLLPGGIMYLSWRVTDGDDVRDERGRLYTAFEATLVRDAVATMTILHDQQSSSLSSGRRIHRLVAQKPSSVLHKARNPEN